MTIYVIYVSLTCDEMQFQCQRLCISNTVIQYKTSKAVVILMFCFLYNATVIGSSLRTDCMLSDLHKLVFKAVFPRIALVNPILL